MVSLLVLLLSLAEPPSIAPPPGAVIVTDRTWTGLGVVWDAPGRRVLTALHVVEEMSPERVEVVVPGRGPVAAQIVDREPSLDLAVLEVAGELPAGPPLRAARAVVAGDPVWLPGCGGGSGCSEQAGHVLLPLRAFAGATYVSVRAPVAPGWSGRPILDGSGALVGIVDLALVREPGTALAIPADLAAARFPRG